ncbi:NADAR family protein [Marinactinospora rubrisoli]|uniref:NADAR family protein n=1 Tax=Marinactinospora rubrisoli TaxID=2715399 RepID=A0ABW2KD53_9ACTN
MGDMPPMTIEELRERSARGDRLKYLFFWGHRPTRDGSVGAGCLSQWWPAPFTVAGTVYPTAEHWMMAEKARLFEDTETAARIIAAPHPRAAKALGRRVRGFDEAVWRASRFGIVVRGSTEKFGQHPDLGEYLIGSGNRVLVEASPVDRIWGIGLAADDERAADPHAWRGENLLGFALMRARAELARR